MKKVILVRHGKGVNFRPDIDDFNRALVPKGKRDSRRMAKRLLSHAITPELMIASPADRALETAHLFARVLNYPVRDIRLEFSLYREGSPQTIFDVLHHLDDKLSSVILFGHNPGFTDFVRAVLPDFPFNLAKSAMVGVAFDSDTWKNVEAQGQLFLFEYPVSQKKMGETEKHIRKEIRLKLQQAAADVLDTFDPSTRKQMETDIRKRSKQLAKAFTDHSGAFFLQRMHALLQKDSDAGLEAGAESEVSEAGKK